MRQLVADMMRGLFQSKLVEVEDRDPRGERYWDVTLADLDVEQINIVHEFVGCVGNHELESLVPQKNARLAWVEPSGALMGALDTIKAVRDVLMTTQWVDEWHPCPGDEFDEPVPTCKGCQAIQWRGHRDGCEWKAAMDKLDGLEAILKHVTKDRR